MLVKEEQINYAICHQAYASMINECQYTIKREESLINTETWRSQQIKYINIKKCKLFSLFFSNYS